MTTPVHPDTDIVTDDKVPTIRIIREFDAPVADVFRAHTDAELYAKWSGPHELNTTIGDWECRTGGAWSYQQTDPTGNEYGFYGSFHEIRPNEVIVQTSTFIGFPDGVTLDRLVFEDLGNRRCRLTSVSLVDSFEARDAMISSGMETGIREGYNTLDDILASNTRTQDR